MYKLNIIRQRPPRLQPYPSAPRQLDLATQDLPPVKKAIAETLRPVDQLERQLNGDDA